MNYANLCKSELELLQKQLQERYGEYIDAKLSLDLSRGKPGRAQLDLLTGLCVPKLGMALMRTAGLERPSERAADELTERHLRQLARFTADLTLTVKGVKGFDNAQVTAGGVAVDEFDPATLESRIARGVHAAGEVLDVDGDCGGFNLMFAFGSGILAGLNGRKTPW